MANDPGNLSGIVSVGKEIVKLRDDFHKNHHRNGVASTDANISEQCFEILNNITTSTGIFF